MPAEVAEDLRATDHRIVVVGMSIADVLRRDELYAVCTGLGATLAFLQQGDPAVGDELTRLADAGAPTIVVVGVDLGPVAPGHSWLRRIVGHWLRERSGHRPDVRVASRLAHTPEEIAPTLDLSRPITGTEAALVSSAWEQVPAYRHQAMVCRGPRCTAQGAVDTWRALVLAMMEHGLGDDDVLLVHTGCQFPCNQAPVISVQPDDVWYGRVDPPTAKRIVEQHLIGGDPLDDHRAPGR